MVRRSVRAVHQVQVPYIRVPDAVGNGVRVGGKVDAGRRAQFLAAVFIADHRGNVLDDLRLALRLRGGIARFQKEGKRLFQRRQDGKIPHPAEDPLVVGSVPAV